MVTILLECKIAVNLQSMSDAPAFWWQRPGVAAWALSPLAYVYGKISTWCMLRKPKYRASVPVFCVGNPITGGAGKTPTALAVAKAARRLGRKPGFMSRGYGGHIKTPAMVDCDQHNAHDVGDEPLLLARKYPTVVSADRPKGAALLEAAGVDFIIMDDGFQNSGLAKDFSLMVVNSVRGIGTGYCVPAGPLRAFLGPQLSLAHAVLVIGPGSGAQSVVRQAARRAKPVYQATVVPQNKKSWKNKNVLAFAGIADPEKFYKSLSEAGAKIVQRRDFPDHHPLTDEDCRDLLEMANQNKLTLATTAKDAARLKGGGKYQSELLEKSQVLEIELQFENKRDLDLLVQIAISAFANSSLQQEQ